jgi:prophage maintenance system killer protein
MSKKSARKEQAKKDAQAASQTAAVLSQSAAVTPTAATVAAAPTTAVNTVPAQNMPQQKTSWLKAGCKVIGLSVMGLLGLDIIWGQESPIVSLNSHVIGSEGEIEQDLLNGNVHPGIFTVSTAYSRQNPIAAQELSREILNNLPPHDQYIIDEFLSPPRAFAKRAIRDVGIYEIDQSFAATKLSDVVVNALALRDLKIVLKQQPLQKMSATQMEKFILKLNSLLTGASRDLASAQPAEFCTQELAIFRNGEVFMMPKLMQQWLKKFDPEMLPAYQAMINIIDQMQSSDAIAKYHSSLELMPAMVRQTLELHLALTANNIAARTQLWLITNANYPVNDQKIARFVSKYADMMIDRADVAQQFRGFVHELVKKLRSNEDVYDIAAFAHQKLVAIHPTEDGNGRTARAMMNAILLNAGKRAIVFPSDAEYQDQVSANRKNYKQFAKYLRAMDRMYPQTLTFYKDLQACVDSRPYTECVRQVRARKSELLVCLADDLPKQECTDAAVCRYSV